MDYYEGQIDHFQSQLEDNYLVSQDQLKTIAGTIPMVLKRVEQMYEQSSDQQYIKSLIDPFGPHANGVRIPSLIPESTITSYDY